MHRSSSHRARPPQRLTKVSLGLLFVIILLLGSGTVAQESTPEATPPVLLQTVSGDTNAPHRHAASKCSRAYHDNTRGSAGRCAAAYSSKRAGNDQRA